MIPLTLLISVCPSVCLSHRVVTQCLKWKNVEKCGGVRGYSGNVLLKVNTKLVRHSTTHTHI